MIEMEMEMGEGKCGRSLDGLGVSASGVRWLVVCEV